MRKQEFTSYLSEDRFEDLFMELGWNDYDGDRLLYPADVDGTAYDFYVVAQQSGFMVLKCAVSDLPAISLYKKLDTKLRQSAHDYICIYYVPDAMRQMWIVPVNKVDKRDLVSVKYEDADHATFLFEKVGGFSFEIGRQTNIVDVKNRVQQAFIVNSEAVTKKFYQEFTKQHKAFAKLVFGISDDSDRRWYTSIMLDRMMFCYFIQKKGFLDNDKNYLVDKLREVRQTEGDDEFYAFYCDFLRQLFHDGLNSPNHDTPEFLRKFGRIPYLNGGMFDVHELELKYTGIKIKDEAFESLFAFFDEWEWHLDTRMSASGKDINPDVLGYIFEQFINDRAQMGAYYTKEDITGYIGRNTILPFLFDKMKEKMPALFKAGGKVWQYLQKSGKDYIYEAVRKGYTADWRERIPENIAVGLDTSKPDLLHRREHWNERTAEEFALPTEIWRETVERMQRCDSILSKISSGEIHDINDFITYNLDIRSFAYDLLADTDDHNYVRHFYHALQRITILDPTCGSGAFLFAAMNILEPLYEICISRMQEFNAQNNNLFKDELEEINHKYRSNIQYFIYKSIILRNLYGVDIMAEAIEIAKLRLFLKMVAVVDVDMRAPNLGLDPLPDIDFNIRCGNTLVGYATEQQLEESITFGDMFARIEFKERIQNKLEIVSKTYETFKWLQMNQQDNREAFKEAKKQLRDKLASLNEDLNQHLYGRKPDFGYTPWLLRTQPFHWIAEFYEIMHNGGFDVIIGNPPYVTFTENSLPYKVDGYLCYNTKNLFSLVGERCLCLADGKASIGYIIPLSGLSIVGFESFQKIIFSNRISWNSFYSGDRNPAELFTGVKIRAAIYISRPYACTVKYVTKYIKYYTQERTVLFNKVVYVKETLPGNSAPKIDGDLGLSIICKILQCKNSLGTHLIGKDYFYYHAAPIYWCKALMDTQSLQSLGLNIADSYKKRSIDSQYKDFAFSLLNSTLFFYYWIVNSDCYNETKKYIIEFKIPEVIDFSVFAGLANQLNRSLLDNMQVAEYTYKNRGVVRFAQFFPKKSKPIIDEIDKVLARHYGFTDEELDFIINYDIKYRMGDELNG